MLDEETKRKVDAALKRIAGQISGIQRMIDEERYCVDVLHQVSAVEGAIDRVGQLILGSHIDTCVATALESGNPRTSRKKAQELKEVVGRFRRIRT